ncbi:MAG: hypothetical protein AABX30_02225 [Nanoarchaeota archaeon]
MVKAYLIANYVSDGQFSGEFAIGVTNYRGERTSGFFPASSVKDGKLEVKVLMKQGDKVSVKVPGRFIEGREEAGTGDNIIVKTNSLSFE